MKKCCLLFPFLLLFVLPDLCGQVRVIPKPLRLQEKTGEFLLEQGKIVYTVPWIREEALFLAEQLQEAGISARAEAKAGARIDGNLVLSLLPAVYAPEEYSVHITPKQVVVEASGRVGIFYGIQTLLQLINNREQQEIRLKCRLIQDLPRYAWRGFMLDEARHFFGKEKVMQLLDEMAYYKLNRFHWHLTDEPGWRIEIEKYPLLATKGGQGSWSRPDDPEARYYTQEDIREILAYAARRHIEVIPEIDMPGHATAANKAYPEYSGGGTPEHPEFTFNVGKEETYAYLTDILREVAALFPSRYLHLGGDEVAYGIRAWETDSSVQALMAREGLASVKEAERYFMKRMSDSVYRLGKTLIGWDELLDLEMDPSRTEIMWWRHDRPQNLKRSLEEGYHTVLCPRRPLYFDFIQHREHKWGRVWNGFCPLEDVYAFPDRELAKLEISPEQQSFIRGVQANLWTERVHTGQRLDFMIFPRLCALAESGWCAPGNKDFADFERRLQDAYRRLDAAGIYYFDHREPQRHPEPEGCNQPKKEVPMDFRD
ncbi:MAG: beta-N-acetylhexosaminidase [Culturomica sp.]|nr:beta-N-acetylhexosaminidase [Culturomica sp.]